VRQTAPQYYLRFQPGSAPNPTRLMHREKHSTAPQRALQFFNMLSAGQLVPGGRYVTCPSKNLIFSTARPYDQVASFSFRWKIYTTNSFIFTNRSSMTTIELKTSNLSLLRKNLSLLRKLVILCCCGN